MNPKLVIIIPAFNEEENLSRVLTDLVNQRNPDGALIDKALYQIVVVDNSSTDNTFNIAKEFSQKYPNCNVIIEKEKSIVAARKTGATYALNKFPSLEYLAFCDADHIYVPNTWIYSILENFENKKRMQMFFPLWGPFH